MKFWLFALCLFAAGAAGQEWFPTGTRAPVADPLETRYPLMEKITRDTLFRGEAGLHWQRLFGVDGLHDYALTTGIPFSKRFAIFTDIRNFGWERYEKWQIQMGIIISMPKLKNTVSFGVRIRNTDFGGYIRNTSGQFDLSGIYNPFQRLSLYWVMNNVFGFSNKGPGQGRIGVGVNFQFFRYLTIGLGTEKNYLYPSNTFVSIHGSLPAGVGGGISYLFLERCFNFFFSYRKGFFEFVIGGTLHPLLGETYRSSVNVIIR